MREPVPEFPTGPYERPNQPWVCGLAMSGRACPAGPLANGRCPALAECAPVRDGDRWRCNRSALRGGECEAGPAPDGTCGCINRCTPVRSLRAVRGRLVMGSIALLVGTLCVVMSSPSRDRVISPGALARQHAQLLEGHAHEARCAACHAAGAEGFAGWLVSLAGVQQARATQSNLCMECHGESIGDEFALVAHNVAPDVLHSITQQREADASLGNEGGARKASGALLQAPSVAATERLACASCHDEHNGAGFDLRAMSNAACQRCHHTRYDAFTGDHPEFGDWPYKRPTRIVFDHASHGAKHFPEAKRAFDCRSCHVDDTSGDVQLTAGYEAACASCHDEKIATSLGEAVPMLLMPTLDLEVIRAANLEAPSDWAPAARGDFDGRLPPAMKLLLGADRPAAQAMRTLGADFEFYDVDPDDPSHVKASAALAQAIRRLAQDLSRGDPGAMRARLSTALAREVTDRELQALFAGLSQDMQRETARAWFAEIGTSEPDSESDIEKVTTNASGAPASAAHRALAYAPAGTWQHDASTLTLRYQPSGHADPVLTGWIELLAATPGISQHPIGGPMLEELTRPTSAGLCASCHRVEAQQDASVAVHWRSYDGRDAPRGLTRFTHGPHLVLPELADCTSCHSINPPGGVTSADMPADTALSSGFAPMAKQHCATCHTTRAAGDACQQCHNYHVEEMEAWRLELAD